MKWMTKTAAFEEILHQELIPLLPFVNSATLFGMVADSMEESERLHAVSDRQVLHNVLRENMNDEGKTAIHVWQRDCDGVEATTIAWIEADVATYEAFVESLYDQAEGPVFVSIMSLDQARMFTPTWRDTYAAAAGY